jgi:hypothetical protein
VMIGEELKGIQMGFGMLCFGKLECLFFVRVYVLEEVLG